MIQIASLMGLLWFSPSFASPAPVEKWVADQVSYSFDTWIRIETQGKIVSAEDSRIQGEPGSFVQSLLYTANKSSEFQGTFTSESELQALMKKELCSSIHEVELRPVLYGGARGTQKFQSKLKAFSITITGKSTINAVTKPFSVYAICEKPPVFN